MATQINGTLALSQSDWQAVTVALRDVERNAYADTDRAEGPLVRAFRLLTGFEAPKPLADPRLDTVRRFVSAVRTHSARVRDLVPELLRFGYTPAQIEALRIVAA